MSEEKNSHPPKKRCAVYIDGFNWYFSIFKHYPGLKWLNIQSYFEALRLDDNIVAIKFFTALVNPDHKQSQARDRQKRYLKALGTLSNVKVIYGKYQNREVTCRATCREKYLVPEEKKTDVNIAVNLINDTIKDIADTFIIVSGDSDLEPPIEWIRENYPKKKLYVYIPSLPEEQKSRRNDKYSSIGVTCRFLPLPDLKNHLLPNTISLPNGKTIDKPSDWHSKRENLP